MDLIKSKIQLPGNFQIDPLDRWMAETLSSVCKYEGPRSGVFIDVGAHVGVVSVRAALQGFGPIYCFEASKPNYDKLVHNMQGLPAKGDCSGEGAQAHLYNLAVTDKTGDDFTLYGFTNEGGRFNTGMRSAFYNAEKHQVESVVKTISFYDVLNVGKDIQFLKVDIEGGEYDIFKPCSRLEELLSHVKYLSLELHDLIDLNYFRSIDFGERFPWLESPETALIEVIAYLHSLGFSDMNYEEVMNTQTIEFSSYNHKFNEASEGGVKNV